MKRSTLKIAVALTALALTLTSCNPSPDEEKKSTSTESSRNTENPAPAASDGKQFTEAELKAFADSYTAGSENSTIKTLTVGAQNAQAKQEASSIRPDNCSGVLTELYGTNADAWPMVMITTLGPTLVGRSIVSGVSSQEMSSALTEYKKLVKQCPTIEMDVAGSTAKNSYVLKESSESKLDDFTVIETTSEIDVAGQKIANKILTVRGRVDNVGISLETVAAPGAEPDVAALVAEMEKIADKISNEI